MQQLYQMFLFGQAEIRHPCLHSGYKEKYILLQMKINPVTIPVILFVSLCLVVCALSCVGNCGPRFFRRLYLPFFRHNSASGSSVLNISSPFDFRRRGPIISGTKVAV